MVVENIPEKVGMEPSASDIYASTLPLTLTAPDCCSMPTTSKATWYIKALCYPQSDIFCHQLFMEVHSQ